MEMRSYCIICKKIVDRRFVLKATDTKLANGIESHLCNDCYNRMVSSHYTKGRFKVSQFFAWARNKDRFRL